MFKALSIYVIFLLISFLPLFSYGQKDTVKGIEYKEFKLKRGTIVLMGDSVFIAQNDTSLLLPKTAKIHFANDSMQNDEHRTELLLDSLKAYSCKTRLTKELYDLIFTPVEHKNEAPISLEVERNEKIFEPFAKRIIRNVSFKKFNVFGTSVNDTMLASLSLLEKAGNKSLRAESS